MSMCSRKIVLKRMRPWLLKAIFEALAQPLADHRAFMASDNQQKSVIIHMM
jgi:hypothetical protein